MNQEFPALPYLDIIVDKGQSPVRIDKFLVDKLSNCTRTKLQTAIEDGKILVFDLPIKANYKVRPLDEIRIYYNDNREDKEDIVPENLELTIVYEEEDFLVLNKPAGMVVHPAHGHWRGTLLNALAYYFQSQNQNWQDLPRLGLVHRIDKDTSGLLVIGKNLAAIHSLSKQFAEHSIHRRYLALVWGNVGENGTICKRIGRHKRYRQLFDAYMPESEIGKAAITHYTVLENWYYVSLLECRLETGRTHQIRVHMKSIGHPIFGDPVYGGNKIVTGTRYPKYENFVNNCLQVLPRQALHAIELGFKHPRTQNWIYFKAPVPQDLQSVLENWNKYFQHRREAVSL